MTQTLTDADVRNIARLARIDVTDDEVEQYRKELSAVLTSFSELDSVDTDGIEPIGHITGRTNVLRDDVAVPCDEDTKRRIMENVPRTQDGAIVVTHVLKTE